MNVEKQAVPTPGGESLPRSEVAQEVRFEPRLIPVSDRADDFQPIKHLTVGDPVKKKAMFNDRMSLPEDGQVIHVHRVILHPENRGRFRGPTDLPDFTALFLHSGTGVLLEFEFDSRMFERAEEIREGSVT